MRKIIYAVFSLVTAVSVVSCSDTDNAYILTQYYNADECFNVVAADDRHTIATGVEYTFDFNYTDNSVSVRIAGLSDGDNTYSPFVLRDLRWSYKDNWKTVNAHDISPDVENSGDVPDFTSFEMSVLDRVVNGSPKTVVQIKYQLENGVTYITYPRSMLWFGKTTVTAENTPDFTSTESSYELLLDPVASTASLKVNNARFASAMPVGMNMEFKGISFTTDDAATVTLEKEALIPEIGGDPYPSFAISQLEGQFSLLRGMSLQFHCAAMGKDYTVNADCQVFPVRASE